MILFEVVETIIFFVKISINWWKIRKKTFRVWLTYIKIRNFVVLHC